MPKDSAEVINKLRDSNAALLHLCTSRDFVVKKMLPEMKELVATFEPQVIWSDGDWEADPDYFGSKDFLAWLYSDSPVKDKVVTNDRSVLLTFPRQGEVGSSWQIVKAPYCEGAGVGGQSQEPTVRL